MDDFETALVADFIDEHWALFVASLVAKGLTEADAETIVGAMKKNG